jgi:hypothetical protein
VPAEAVRWGLTQGEMACPDCPLANIQPEMPSQGAGRILHHILWEHLHFVPEGLQLGIMMHHREKQAV